MSCAQREPPKEYTGPAVGANQNVIDFDDVKNAPYFDKMASKNVTALLGKTAHLNCRVKNLGNKTVSEIYSQSVFGRY